MFYLPEVVNIYNVSEVKKNLLNILESENEKEIISLNAEKMEDIDGAGIQLLLSFIKSVNKNNKQVEIINKSDDIKRLFSISGLNCTVKGLVK
ncbi:MAG: STAS domain-containing protein [Bacillota bacterium]